MEELNYHPSEIEIWTRKNLQVIHKELSLGAEIGYNGYIELDLNRAKRFDLVERSLSEMPICAALKKVPIPSGWKRVTTKTSWPDLGQRWSTPHTYFVRLDDESVVYDLTPGQFVMSFDPGTEPNQRIGLMKQRNKELITICSEQISFLSGNKNIIKKEFGILY